MSDNNRADATFGAYAAALGLIVAVLLVMAFVVTTRSEEHIPSVDYRPDARVLGNAADYTVHVPEELPAGWVPTSSRLDVGEDEEEPATWTVGFATPEDMHARVSMSDADPERFIADTTGHGTPAGESEVDGETWERYTGREAPQRSLVRREDGVTLVVTGSAGYTELETLAGSLRPRT